jgi:hypothetical protein
MLNTSTCFHQGDFGYAAGYHVRCSGGTILRQHHRAELELEVFKLELEVFK